MQDQWIRSELVFGKEAVASLAECRVAVFGVGGVGGYVVEALARSGVGHLVLIDSDDVDITNLNRQIIATRETIGRSKVDVAAERIHSINPDCEVIGRKIFYLPETAESFDFTAFDYVVDAIDTVAAKVDIIVRCTECGTPVISSMGCGNRIDPTRLAVTDIYKTSYDPLAKVMRSKLKKRGVRKLKVVASTEPAIQPDAAVMEEITAENDRPKRRVPGSTAFVPAAAGLIIASEVIKDLTHFDPSGRVKGGGDPRKNQ